MADLQEQIGERLEPYKEKWDELPTRTRLGVSIGAAALIAIAILVAATYNDVEYEPLFSNLEEDDAAQIVSRLRDMKIPYKLESNGTAILVPEPNVHDTRLSLASEGLPNGGGIGFEIFDEQRFGESDFSEQVKYHRALEGELSRSIGHLDGVDSARVHLVLPKRSLFATKQPPATASVVLKLEPGWKIREDRVAGIVHLVAASVRGLDTRNVTVVDGQGRKLSNGEADDELVAKDVVEFRNQVQSSKEKSIQEILDATLGPDRSLVKVAAEVDFSREERTEEHYDPEKVVTRSRQITEEKERGTEGAVTGGGVPGAPSNLPGGDPAGARPGGTTNIERRTETQNFEVSVVKRHSVEPVGRVSLLKIAVVVDGEWSEPKDGKREFTPLKEKELKTIQKIVASAAGIQEKRGDEVTVECVPFAASAYVPEPEVTDIFEPYYKYKPYAYLGGGVLGFFMVIIAFFVLKRKLKKLAAEREEEAKQVDVSVLATGPATVRELEANLTESTTDLREMAEEASKLRTKDAEAASEARQLAVELATTDPEAAARIVRGWLNQADSSLPREQEDPEPQAAE